MNNANLIKELNTSLEMVVEPGIGLEDLQALIADRVNHLIQHDFQQLIFVLYRIDVSEQKLKLLLNQHPAEDAGKLIAAMIIERQLQKIATRQQYSKRGDDLTEEEKW